MLGLITSFSYGQQIDAAARRKGWIDDYQKARKIAKKTGKPMLVVFRCKP